MSHIDQGVLAPIRARLLQNKRTRDKYGALLQDRECGEGEVFYGNMTPDEFEALPLRTKRKGNPAYAVRLFFKKADKAEGMSHVFRETYEQVYKDKDSCGVFVHTFELDIFGIEY